MKEAPKRHNWRLLFLVNILTSILVVHLTAIHLKEKAVEAQSCAPLSLTFGGVWSTGSTIFAHKTNVLTEQGQACPTGYEPHLAGPFGLYICYQKNAVFYP